ncbi:MAG: metalloregulator ArsR/SmtB family transcription factor [Anaerolineales bacterium]|nr:metalloregulator ArsR/SmtB family transcription factor [Anaerolineales bacterium]
MNVKKQPFLKATEQIAAPLTNIASPQRIAILLLIGEGEACVCHLEASLGWRQAYISQHLMALRKAGILQARREGRFIFYSLKDIAILDLVIASATLSGLSDETVSELISTQFNQSCECPQCTPMLISVDGE